MSPTRAGEAHANGTEQKGKECMTVSRVVVLDKARAVRREKGEKRQHSKDVVFGTSEEISEFPSRFTYVTNKNKERPRRQLFLVEFRLEGQERYKSHAEHADTYRNKATLLLSRKHITQGHRSMPRYFQASRWCVRVYMANATTAAIFSHICITYHTSHLTSRRRSHASRRYTRGVLCAKYLAGRPTPQPQACSSEGRACC